MCAIKAMRAFFLSCKNKKAVLSVETALVLPVFLFVMLLLMSFTSIFYISVKMDAAISEEAKLTARNIYDNSNYGVGGIEASVCERLGDGLLNSGLIYGGKAGLDFSDSDISGSEVICVCANYNISLPFDLFGVSHSKQCRLQKCIIMHSWVGYVHGLDSFTNLAEYVYMTANGTVYHRNRECSHIRLHIQSVDGKDIKKSRNSSGGKYKRCVYCKPRLSDEKLYITSDGDRYHNTLNCSGLKRSVYRVKVQDLVGVSPCSRCGY